ncbi:recombinase family protein [Mesorhizobium sp. CN2-181]|uniref:recombinase family protein n=1 Tax=Mesorhizobium yinganensis TaxID=3157707 RepID=UPI0032B75E6E
MSAVPKLRCAVYTRKSTDEGLDQEFSSLDAQREACVAFIASQVGLGWKLVHDRYDDGGISGGTMERPALQRLLQDIRDRKVDVVVVYKIDRLTRSLVDFSKIVEIFDASNASFVSVTQQFNTTTSMGRLTLNVLLSFAQFEREVTAERIRDKIAASRRKGMWMGGRVPFGYRIEGKKLLINDQEAGTVRAIFDRYLELKSVPALVRELNRGEGRFADATGEWPGDSAPTSAGRQRHYRYGQLYHVLSNPVYIGKARHKGQLHDGEHAAIIDEMTFEATQSLLKQLSPDRRSQTSTPDLHLLTGILFDETGDRLTPTSTANHGRRYRYYVSNRLVKSKQRDPSGWRLPAAEIEAAVLQRYRSLLSDQSRIADWATIHRGKELVPEALKAATEMLGNLAGEPGLTADGCADLVRRVFPKITLTSEAIIFQIDAAAMIDTLLPGDGALPDPVRPNPTEQTSEAIPITVRRRGNEARIVLPGSNSREPDQKLTDLIVTANRLLKRLTDGSARSIGELANSFAMDRSDVRRVLRLAFLAPSIVEDISSGRQPPSLTARMLSRFEDLSFGWNEQRAQLGF